MPIPAGTHLGPYEIVAPIGAGGMGEVFRARDTRLDRTVAVKILSAELGASAQFKLRFEREAKAISQLSHPHICVLYDVGETTLEATAPGDSISLVSAPHSVSYLVMEYLEGETLADRIARGPLPLHEVIRYAIQIADALDKAHRQGVIHRDLKPGNVMLTRSGAKLLDFGLARTDAVVSPAAGLTDLPTQHKPLTQEGTILGTFQYMAPEQLEAQEADARTDIFAFGCLLYEMATGLRAFQGKTRTSLIAAIVSAQPQPITEIQPLTPPALDHVIQRCLQKDPEDRWQSAHDIAEELRWISAAGSQAGVAAPLINRRRSRERLAWIAAATALVAAIAAATVAARLSGREERIYKAHLVAPANAGFATLGEHSGSLTLSPDGRYLTFAGRDAEGKVRLMLRRVDSLTAEPLAGTDGAMFPFWSPDSRSLAFFADGKLKKIDLAGSPPVILADAPRGRSGGWNREGIILFSPHSVTGIQQVSSGGGTATPATELDGSQGETTHRWATFLPDGKHFLYMAGTHGGGTRSEANAIYIGTLGSKERKLLLHTRSNVLYASGHLLYLRDAVLMAHPFDTRRLELQGEPVPIAENIRYDVAFFRAVFAASENGLLVYQTGSSDRNVTLAWHSFAGEKGEPLGEPALYGDLAFSPDGRHLMMEIEDPGSGTTDLWLYDVSRNVRTRFTFEPGSEGSPVWSPDGSAVIYSTTTGARRELKLKKVRGSGEEETLLGSEEGKDPSSWSPDGRHVAYVRDDFTGKTKSDIWILPLEGDRTPFPFLQTPFAEWSPFFSPDGRWILYGSDESGRSEVYIAPFPGPGGKWQVSTNGAAFGVWRQNGKEIVITGGDSGLRTIPVRIDGDAIELGSPTLHQRFTNVVAGTLHPDGERLLLGMQKTIEENVPVTLISNWLSDLETRTAAAR
ncbi:MAG TPA: protein kinase [Thermoanaerobaculia bacterium]|nr:protein kinase [Thermoanaerobaculia bacterium]